jgi:hypothetical protein
MKTFFNLQNISNENSPKKKLKKNLILNTQIRNQIFPNSNKSSYSKKNFLLSSFSLISDSNSSREKNKLHLSNKKFPTIITPTLRKKIKNNTNKNSNSSYFSFSKRNFLNQTSSIENYMVSAYSLINKIKVLPFKLNKPKLLQETLNDKIKIFSEKINKKIIKNYSNPKKLNKLPSKINLNYFYEEKKDKINNYNLKDYYFHKDIILAMKNFNSPFPKNEKIHFYDSYENKINFLFDSVFYPHFVNTLMWKKINFDDKNVMNTELCNLNLFSKEISLALNMKRAILFNPINNINDQSINDDEKEKEIENIKNLRRKYDIIDFFAKKYERKDITFANNKDRKICFSRDFNQGKFLNSF